MDLVRRLIELSEASHTFYGDHPLRECIYMLKYFV